MQAVKMKSGDTFWANRGTDKARLLWRVVEPSMGRPGWLCRMVEGNSTVHSSDLQNIERCPTS